MQSNILLKRTDNSDPDFKSLVVLLDNFLHELNGDASADYTPHNKLDYLDTAIVAYADNAAAGCGCFKKYDDETVEVKRMFVKDTARGKGIASTILNELEIWAKEKGYLYTVLETLKSNTEAVNLYKKYGYGVIDNYGPYVNLPGSICMRKAL